MRTICRIIIENCVCKKTQMYCSCAIKLTHSNVNCHLRAQTREETFQESGSEVIWFMGQTDEWKME